VVHDCSAPRGQRALVPTLARPRLGGSSAARGGERVSRRDGFARTKTLPEGSCLAFDPPKGRVRELMFAQSSPASVHEETATKDDFTLPLEVVQFGIDGLLAGNPVPLPGCSCLASDLPRRKPSGRVRTSSTRPGNSPPPPELANCASSETEPSYCFRLGGVLS
jgi:hypothetical protein